MGLDIVAGLRAYEKTVRGTSLKVDTEPTKGASLEISPIELLRAIKL